MKERVPLLVGVFLVVALLYAAFEFVIIRSPMFGLIALAGAIVVAVIVAMRLRPAA
jgi:hypothetical protein